MHDASITENAQRVLVVCESTGQQVFLQRILEEENCQVTVSSPSEALTFYKSEDIDMIVTELEEQPEIVMTLCRQLRHVLREPELPFLVSLDVDQADLIGDVIEAGATDFLIHDEENNLLFRHRLRLAVRSLREKQALRLHQERQEHAHRVAKIGHWDWDVVNRNLYWSDEIFELIGVEKGRYRTNNATYLSTLYEDDKERVLQATHNSLQYGTPYSIEHRVKRSDGKLQYIAQDAELIFNKRGEVVRMRGIMQDITERYLAHQKIQHQAYHDALTGLPNRLLFQDRLNHALQLSARSQVDVAILFIDLDRFKAINDTLGHKIGDEFLRQVSENLRHCVRASDTLARLGGDEFALIVENVGSESEVTLVADKLIKAIACPVQVEGHDLFPSGSVGISMTREDSTDRDQLIREADVAMYHAKELGGSQYFFYSENMQMRVNESLSIERELRHAIENDQLVVHYQPKVCVQSGRIRGVEALLRWEHPERGLMPPDSFIPLAEKTGLIISIGKWVLRKACEQAVEWHRNGYPDLTVSVNVSVRQFNDTAFYDDVVSVLNDTGIDPVKVDLEITESCTISNIQRTIEILQKLRTHGVTISLDDFGTGFSSLSFLNQLPLDALKVDRSFIRDIRDSQCDGELARLIIGIASSLKLNVVAEGVETESHLSFLRMNGCDEYQGYYLSPPVSSDGFEQLLHEQPAADLVLPMVSNG